MAGTDTRFQNRAEHANLFVQVVRPPSHKLDNQIAGTVWLDDFSLTAAP